MPAIRAPDYATEPAAIFTAGPVCAMRFAYFDFSLEPLLLLPVEGAGEVAPPVPPPLLPAPLVLLPLVPPEAPWLPDVPPAPALELEPDLA